MTPANYIGRAITMVDELKKPQISAGWRCCPACLLRLSTFVFSLYLPFPLVYLMFTPITHNRVTLF